MSQTIDSRVVEMQFDNSQFESNVNTSISTLDKLKAALNFGKVEHSLDDLGDSINKANVNGLSESLEEVQNKFLSFGNVLKAKVFGHISDEIINLTTKVTALGKELTFDQIGAGWTKFGQKTNSVATLVGQGYELDLVNEQLERLNWFTDETSYNFTDMVENISKFTASGQELGPSVTAMEGIANWAALSGQNATTASRAMYQLSQAMGKGALKYDDYKSIQNASMDTVEFRQKCLDAAVALGTLKKTGEDTYSVIGNEKHKFDINTFTEYLSKDAWLTSDVMMSVFNQYSAAVDQIYEYAEEKGLTASEAMEELGDSIDEFGLKAFKSAQQARTFEDVIDSVKDAASTAWMNTFELIIGDYEQATELFTDMANSAYDIFVEPINKINELLEDALGQTQQKPIGLDEYLGLDLSPAASSGIEKALTEVARAHGIAIDDMIAQEGSFKETLKNGWLSTDLIHEALENFTTDIGTSQEKLEKIHELAKEVVKGTYGDDWNLRIEKLKEAGVDDDTIQRTRDFVNKLHEMTGGVWDFSDATLEQVDAFFATTEVLNGMSDAELEALGYTKEEIDALRELAATAEEAGSPISELTDSFEGLSGREMLIESVKNALGAVGEILDNIGAAWKIVFGELPSETIFGVIEKIHQFSEGLKMSDENARNFRFTFKGLFSVLDFFKNVLIAIGEHIMPIVARVVDKFGSTILRITASIGHFFQRLNQVIKKNDLINKFFEAITPILNKAADGIEVALDFIADLFEKVFSAIEGGLPGFIEALSKGLGGIKDIITSILGKITLPAVLDLAKKGGIVYGLFALVGAFLSIRNKFKKVGKAFTGLKDIFKNVGKVFSGVVDVIEGLAKVANAKARDLNATAFLKTIGAIALLIGVLTATMYVLGTMKPEQAKQGFKYMAYIALIVGSFAVVVSLIQKMGGSSGGIGSAISGFFSSLTESFRSFLKLAGIGIAAVGIGAAILMIVNALKTLMGLDWSKSGPALAALAGIAAGLLGFMFALTKMPDSKNVGFKTAITMIAIALAIKILTEALESIGKLKAEDMAKGLIGVVGLLLGLAVAMRVLKESGDIRTSITLIAFAYAIKILSDALIALSQLKADQLGKSLLSIVALLFSLAASMRLLKESGDIRTSITLIAFAYAIKILGDALIALGQLNADQLGKGLLSIVVLLLSLATSMRLLKESGDIRTSITLIAFAYAIKILGDALLTLSEIEGRALARSLAALVVVMLSLVSAMKMLGKSGGLGTSATLLAMAASMKMLTGSLVEISSLSTNQTVRSVLALVTMLGALSLAMKLMSGNLGSVAGAAGMVIVAASLHIVVAAIKKLADMGVEQLLPTVLSLSAILLAMAGVLAISSVFGVAMIPGAIGFIAGLGIVMLGVLGLLGILALLEPIISKGKNRFNKIGEVIGEFVGSIAKGVLVKLAEGIGSFGEVLDQYNFDQDKIDKVKYLCDMLNSVRDNLPETGGLKQIMGGFKDLGRFGKDLANVAEGVGNFGEVLDKYTYDPNQVEAVGNLCHIMAAVNNELPDTGGLKQVIFGYKDLGKFGDDLCNVAVGVGAFGATMQEYTYDSEQIEAVGNLCHIMAAVNNELPDVGGLEQIIFGYKDLGQFGDDLVNVANGVGAFGETMRQYTYDPDQIEAVGTLCEMMVEVNNGLPEVGGLKQIFEGYKDLGQFGDDLVNVANGVGAFAETMQLYTFGGENQDAVIKLCQDMVTIQNELPKTGGFKQAVDGWKNLGQFGDDLVDVAIGVGSFGLVLDTYEFGGDNQTAIIALCESMVAIQNKLPPGGGFKQKVDGYKDLGDFGDNLVVVAKGMGAFGEVLDAYNFDLGKIFKVGMLGAFMVSIQNLLPETDGVKQFWEGHKDLGDFGFELVPVALGMGAFAATLTLCNFDDQKIKSAKNLLTFLGALAGDVPIEKGLLGKIIGGDSGFDNFGTGMEKVGGGLKKFMDAINDSGFNAAGYDIATKALTFLKDLANDVPPETGLLGLLFGGQDGLGSFSDNIANVGQGLGTFSTNIKEIDSGNISTAMIALNGIASISSTQGFQDSSTLDKFGESVEALGKKLKAYCEAISGVNLSEVYNSVACVERLIEAINNTKDINADGIGAFKEAVTSLGTTDVTGLLAPLVAQSDAITSATSQISSAFSAGLTGDTSGIGDAGVTMVTALATAINDNLGVVTTAAEGVANEVYTGIQSKGDPTIQAMLGIMNETLKQVTDKQESFGTESATCAENVLTGLGSKNDGISKVFTTSISSALTSVNRYADFYNRAVFNASGVLNGMGSKNSSIKTVFSSPLSGAISNVSGYSSKFSSAGSTLGSAFAQSLSSKITNIVNDVQRRIRELADWVNGQLRSLNSAISQTRNNAAKANKPNASATKDSRQQIMSNVEDSVKEGFTNGLSKVAAFIDNGMISQPTIVPVMDLSQIQNGVATINSMFASGGFNAISASMSGRSNMVTNADIVTAINNLEKSIDGIGDTYNINGITYDDGSNIATAVKMLTRAAMMERRG